MPLQKHLLHQFVMMLDLVISSAGRQPIDQHQKMKLTLAAASAVLWQQQTFAMSDMLM